MNAVVPDQLLYTVRLTFTYVLILEWLRPDDERTGEQLAQHLADAGVPVSFVRCESEDDLLHALEEAYKAMPDRGIPAVHIECHGVEPSDDLEDDSAFSDGVDGYFEWADLGDWLAPINEASGFQLLLVGAACYGHAAISTINVNRTAAFAGCVGFTTEVEDIALRNAMVELYSGLLVRGDDFRVAVQAAQGRLHEGQRIDMATALSLAYAVLRCVNGRDGGMGDPRGGIKRYMEEIEALARKLPSHLVGGDVDEWLRERTRHHFTETWNTWFPPTLQESDPNYRLNWDIVNA